MWYLIITIIFVNIVFYYSSKRDAKYREGMLFLVTLPDYALESMEVQKIITHYNKYLDLMLSSSFITTAVFVLLANLFSSLLFTFILIMLIFINISIIQIPFKKAREKLLEVKKQNNWLIINDKAYKVDLELSSLMEQHSFGLKRYIIVI